MKGMLARVATGRAIGLLIGDQELVLSLVAWTPLGPLELEKRREVVGEGERVDAAVGRILGPVLEQEAWKHAPIAVGLPVLRVFFSTRPVKSVNVDASPQTLLHEVLQSSNLVIDDMDVDMIKSQPGKQPVASIIATRKKYLAPVLEGLEGCGARPSQVEPAPFALLRAAIRRQRTPRGARGVLRVFLGTDRGLAILTAQDQPLAWRYFDLAEGSESGGVAAIVSSLRTLSKYYGLDVPPDLVMVHGRPDLGRFEEQPEWSQGELRVRHVEGPAFEDGAIAYGLALGCNAEHDGLNLARSIRPRKSLARVMPFGQIALQGLVMAGATLLLHDYQANVGRRLDHVGTMLERHEWLKNKSVGELQKEKGALTKEVEAIQNYLGVGLRWTACLGEVSTYLPPTMVVSLVEGKNKLAEGKKTKESERQLVLSMRAPISGSGAVPAEVDSYMSALRNDEVIRKGLPQIKLSALRWSSDQQTRQPFVAFTVTCQSDPPKKGAAKAH